MAVFTVLGDTEVAVVSDCFGLGAVQRIRAIAAGTINSNYELVTERGRYFLRVNEGKAEADVAWEARLVSALAAGGVITPAPLTALDGRPYGPLYAASTASSSGTVHRKWVSVFPWRDGKHLAANEITEDIAATFGAALADLHRIGLELPITWRRGSIYDHDHLVSRYERVTRNVDGSLTHALEILGDELAFTGNAMYVRRRATQGIIHGDLFRDNVLWDGGAITAILDFEQASGGSLAYDIAVCINDWCWDDGPRIDLAKALLAGYQRVRPLSVTDREALPIEVRAAAARFTITRITDVYLARVPNPEKDFRAFLARCEAWRGPALGELTSAV